MSLTMLKKLIIHLTVLNKLMIHLALNKLILNKLMLHKLMLHKLLNLLLPPAALRKPGGSKLPGAKCRRCAGGTSPPTESMDAGRAVVTKDEARSYQGWNQMLGRLVG